jgi:hypothetical protein
MAGRPLWTAGAVQAGCRQPVRNVLPLPASENPTGHRLAVDRARCDGHGRRAPVRVPRLNGPGRSLRGGTGCQAGGDTGIRQDVEPCNSSHISVGVRTMRALTSPQCGQRATRPGPRS